jgi:hypothetical protein
MNDVGAEKLLAGSYARELSKTMTAELQQSQGVVN